MNALARASLLTLALALAALRQREQWPPAGLGRGGFRVRRAGRGGPRRDAARARGRHGRGRRAAVRGRCRSAAGRREHDAAQVAEARARLARLEAAQQRGRDRRAGGAGEARRGDAALSTAELERQQPLPRKASPRRRSSTPRRRTSIATRRRWRKCAGRSRSRSSPRARKTSRRRASRSRPRRRGRRGRDQARAAQARLAGERRGAADLLPAGRDGAGGPAGARRSCRPATSRCASSSREALLPKIALGDAVEVTCDGCREPIRREGELHRARGRIHAAGDLQPRRAQQARVHDRGARREAGRPARRPAGAGRAKARRRKK